MATSKSSKIMRAPEVGNINLHIVKASATVTLSSIVDVKSVWRYYKLQASTLSKPSKPTTNPPEAGWTTTEPSYTNRSTNNLYFCDLTVFSDNTFIYSDVSLSSSYEAAKAAYNKAQDANDAIDKVATRVTNAETSIKQNSDAIALRATKTEVTSAIDGISVGGTNLLTNTGDGFKPTGGWSQSGSTLVPEGYYEYWYYEIPKTDPYYETKVGDVVTISFDAEVYDPEGLNSGWLKLYDDSNIHASVSIGLDSITFPPNSIPKSTLVKVRGSSTRTLFSKPNTGDIRGIEFYSGYGSGKYFKISRLKIERGNKATDWSPAQEDLVAESKTYTDAQLKITSDSITSTVSKTYATKTDLAENYTTTVDMNSKIEQTANSIKSEVSEVYQPKGDYAIKSEVDQTIEGVETKITTVTNTANAAQTATNTLNTLIRQSGNGVEVAKKVNGAYTSTKTLMGSDGFYVKDDSGNNLTQIKPSQAIIGKAESKNVLVNSNGINIRNGENTIASFSEDIVELGKNSKNSVINMCNKNGSIEVVADDDDGYGENFTITGKSGTAIRYQALMKDPNKEGYYIPYEKAQVYVNKRVGNSHVKEAGMYAYDKTYGNARILVSVNEPIYDNNYALIDARNIYLTADKSVKINGSGILDVKKSLYIQDNIVSDFVVAEGKCDFWTYRMWNSGIAECWGHTSQTTVSVTSEWGYLYDSGTGHTNGFPGNTTASSALKFNVTIGGKKYTKLFTSVEHCDCNFISFDNAFIIEIGSGLTNLQTPQVFLLRPTSADVTGKFSYHAIGRWKA